MAAGRPALMLTCRRLASARLNRRTQPRPWHGLCSRSMVTGAPSPISTLIDPHAVDAPGSRRDVGLRHAAGLARALPVRAFAVWCVRRPASTPETTAGRFQNDLSAASQREDSAAHRGDAHVTIRRGRRVHSCAWIMPAKPARSW